MVQFDYISRGFTNKVEDKGILCVAFATIEMILMVRFCNQSKMEAEQPDVNRCIERYAEFHHFS